MRKFTQHEIHNTEYIIRGGLGPAEDLEGNVALGSKRDLMKRLHMLQCPTIIVEGKA